MMIGPEPMISTVSIERSWGIVVDLVSLVEAGHKKTRIHRVAKVIACGDISSHTGLFIRTTV